MKKCTVKKCNMKYLAKGFCKKHYFINYRGGNVNAITTPQPAIVEGNIAKIPIIKKGAIVGYFIVDSEYQYLERYIWRISDGYVRTTINGKLVIAHRYIIGATNKPVVDHINRNTLDNRSSNLRACTLSQNAQNTTKHINNKSGYKGVSSNRNGWRATILDRSISNKPIHIGQFSSKIEAAKAYDKAAKKAFGEFAVLNFS